MEFGRAFSFAFDDPDWLKKVGIAALVFLIPVIGPMVLMGWGLEITRRVINNHPEPLPNWDDFSIFVSKGFQAFVVTLAYTLPIILVVICNYGLSFGMIAATVSSDSSNSGIIGNVATIASLCLSCFVILFAIAAGFMIPAAMGNLASTGELGAAFRFNEVFGLVRAAPGAYLLEMLGVGLASIILSPLGMLTCGIGVLITTSYITALQSHLTGQAYNVARATVVKGF
jgi:hypothetical protein